MGLLSGTLRGTVSGNLSGTLSGTLSGSLSGTLIREATVTLFFLIMQSDFVKYRES